MSFSWWCLTSRPSFQHGLLIFKLPSKYMCMDLCMSVSEYKTATWWHLSCATFVKSCCCCSQCYLSALRLHSMISGSLKQTIALNVAVIPLLAHAQRWQCMGAVWNEKNTKQCMHKGMLFRIKVHGVMRAYFQWNTAIWRFVEWGAACCLLCAVWNLRLRC